MTNTCKNCGIKFNGNFCNQCGQKNNPGRFSFKHIFEEVFHAFTHADKGFLSILAKMAIDPGKVAYEYIVEEKRKKYFNLFTFFVLITAVAAFVENKDLALQESVFHNNNEYGYLFNIYSKGLLIITIPILAAFLWLINHRKNGLMFSEYTVFAMVLMSVKSMVDIIVKSLNYLGTAFFSRQGDLDNNIGYAIFLIAIMSYANYSFHKNLRQGSIPKSLLTGICFCAIQAGISIFIVWAVLNDFKGVGIFDMYGIRFSG